MKIQEVCKDTTPRREEIRAKGGDAPDYEPNGIDFVEISDDQLVITVYFLNKAPRDIHKNNIRIDGGRRIRGIKVRAIRPCILDDPELDDCLRVIVDKPGDFSTYTLRFVEAEHGRPGDKPLRGFDPLSAQIDFSFKVNCPSDLDCAPVPECAPEALVEPDINYLAKDFSSFRQLILDRLALIMPGWTERHIPDLGIMLVELLAYTGDYLSYYQDAVATEAYLETARRRISVRRHARLVDYLLHEGCNARAWVVIQTDQPKSSIDLSDAYFITGLNDALPLSNKTLTPESLSSIRVENWEVFEPVETSTAWPVYSAHNRISFYTWGERECCVPVGATSVTLKDWWVTVEEPPAEEPPDAYPNQNVKEQEPRSSAQPQPPAGHSKKRRALSLKVGDVLIFEEVLGPRTGSPDDADPNHRQAVRLISVHPTVDELYDRPIVEIEWCSEDALLFPLCLSSLSDPPRCEYHEDVCIARGNVLLVDHGKTIGPEPLGPVGKKKTISHCEKAGRLSDETILPEQFRPRLRQVPLTFAEPIPTQGCSKSPAVEGGARIAQRFAPASALLTQKPHRAVPQIKLVSIPPAPDGDGPLFTLEELEDPGLAAFRLRFRKTTADEALWGLLAPDTHKLMALYEGADEVPNWLRAALSTDMTALLEDWTPQLDLLASNGNDRHFVVEMDDEGRAHLRFGDGELGRMPEAGTLFKASYRVGNGATGNVGAESILYIVFRTSTTVGIALESRNPMPPIGGTDRETLAEAKLLAPFIFRTDLQRAITAADYARLAELNSGVQRAAGELRWNGSWYEARVGTDAYDEEEADAALLRDVEKTLYRYRRIGHDLEVRQAKLVPLEIVLQVCVLPDYLRGHVKASLLDVFSNRTLIDGSRGFFHPDNITFGDGITLSALVAAAQSVTGVESVSVTKLERFGKGPNGEIEAGILSLGALEIARVDNDPNFRENGVVTFDIRGGR
jgi:hypothetical protein